MLRDPDAVLARGRAMAAARHTSRAVVRRRTGTSSLVNGFKVPDWVTVHTDLPCRLAGADAGASGVRRADAGRAQNDRAARVLSIPYDTDDIADGDLVELTAGENTGVVLRVVEATWQDQATARRLPVITTERPEEWG